MTPTRLSTKERAAVALVVLIWGSNFVVTKIGLHDVGPMLLGGLRFAIASLPFMLVVRPPVLPWRLIVGYGLAQALGQFGLLFIGLALGLPAGVASIVLQTQAFFTVLMAAVLLQERIRVHQWLGLLASAIGLTLILLSGRGGSARVPLAGFLCCLGAAAMWATANIVAVHARRRNPDYDPLALVVWSSAVAIVPFFALAAWREGAAATWFSLVHIGVRSVAALLFLALAATVVAYTLWTRLLKRHSAARIAPFSLLVPVVGLFAAWLVFDERLTAVQWLGVAVVGAGLLIGSFGQRLGRRVQAGPDGATVVRSESQPAPDAM